MTPRPRPHYFMSPVARFKKIATVAATRVETMRDLLVNWNFFIETKVLSCRSWPICANFVFFCLLSLAYLSKMFLLRTKQNVLLRQ